LNKDVSVFVCREMPSLKVGLCCLLPLWQLYQRLLANVSPAYCDVPPVVQALTELFYTAENLAIVSTFMNSKLVSDIISFIRQMQ